MVRAAERHGEKAVFCFPVGALGVPRRRRRRWEGGGSAVGAGMMSLGIAGGYSEEYVWLAAKARFGGRGVRSGRSCHGHGAAIPNRVRPWVRARSAVLQHWP